MRGGGMRLYFTTVRRGWPGGRLRGRGWVGRGGGGGERGGGGGERGGRVLGDDEAHLWGWGNGGAFKGGNVEHVTVYKRGTRRTHPRPRGLRRVCAMTIGGAGGSLKGSAGLREDGVGGMRSAKEKDKRQNRD